MSNPEWLLWPESVAITLIRADASIRTARDYFDRTKDRMCFTMRRFQGRGLSFGTSPERNAPESLTPDQSGFVHRNISCLTGDMETRSSSEPRDRSRNYIPFMNP
ncbi:hypothetical protein Nwi_0408 [Nitrobacter winogradskyi Nb-255]|uniref:Uncharacterized protein n=1 Tax=Nitrobacter winogradskyi (strain ATCC 25391 / DSM 10237 / CIP 104748 / NCIMB 11846 / Nb-255) TaxID=323098 RepID=Q3SVL6_NITWN|nr:hypothetical protein Nwi_0408 [Nitrobacter winogradskyi Nb-255]